MMDHRLGNNPQSVDQRSRCLRSQLGYRVCGQQRCNNHRARREWLSPSLLLVLIECMSTHRSESSDCVATVHRSYSLLRD